MDCFSIKFGVAGKVGATFYAEDEFPITEKNASFLLNRSTIQFDHGQHGEVN